MKVRIDRDRCVGNARCWAAAPDMFHLDDDGYNATDDFDVPAGKEVLARQAADSCPERVIEIFDE
jgi:ferredoxin